MNKPDICIFGASGHAKVVIDVIEREGRYRVAALYDDNLALHGQVFFGYPILGGRDTLLAHYQQGMMTAVIVAIGNNEIRAKVAEWLKRQDVPRVSSVHPSAQIARGVKIGAGSVLMAGAIVNADAVIGDEVIINTGATVDHDNVIADAVHVAPGSHLCGHVSVGYGSFIGAGSVLIPSVHIGTNVVVGAGSTVLNNIADDQRVAGSPCRAI